MQEQAASDLSNIKVPKTAQDIAKAAQEREIREMERQKQQQQEFDDLYGSGEQNYDLWSLKKFEKLLIHNMV